MLELFIFGIAGWIKPDLLGLRFTPARCTVAITASLILGWVACRASYRVLRGIALLLGLGLAGLALLGRGWGGAGLGPLDSVRTQEGVLPLWDGRLELGPHDDLLHLILAAIFLLAAIAPKAWDQVSEGFSEADSLPDSGNSDRESSNLTQ